MHFQCACISATLFLKPERLTESAVVEVLRLASRARPRASDETTMLKLGQVMSSSINY